jgi:iron complex outermembrane recepter protein
MTRYRRFLIAVLLVCCPVVAHSAIEEIVVTAQKRAESIQDVPIAVSAFDAEALEARQIDTFSDLQFNVPNVSYTKTNFSGNNFQIRGIGTLLVAASADSGVAMHINDVYLNTPRIFETEYYDMSQVEILRGPQGTLYGRNATGGAVNLKTARPEIGEFRAQGEVQLGNYSHRKVKGAINIPINDFMAARVAGIYLKRDGYTDNELTGNDIDDREQWSVRGSLRLEPSDRTTIDLIAHYFDEDSSRTRSQKQLCVQDPSPILGCLPTGLATEALNPFSTLGSLLASDLVLGPLGIYNYFGFENTNVNPSNLRKVRSLNDPRYESDETFAMLEVQHGLTESLDLNVVVAYQDSMAESRQDYWPMSGTDGDAFIPAGFCAANPNTCSFFNTQDGGPIWSTVVAGAQNEALGALAGSFLQTTVAHTADDVSTVDGDQWSGEVRLTSGLDGPFNYMVAGSYTEYQGEFHYFVNAPGLDYPALALAGGDATAAAFGVPTGFASLAPPMFNNPTNDYQLESWAAFGEAYWQVNDSVKLTVGLRYTEDEKSVVDGQVLFNFLSIVDTADGQVYHAAGNGTLTPVDTVLEMAAAAAAAGEYDAAPSQPGFQDRRRDTLKFDEWTGRIVLDWTPELAGTDSTLLYFSYSKGYKGGGINPAIDPALFPNTPELFAPEKINAFEIGTKNTLWDNRLQANASVFYYDYKDMQIGKIQNRTSINENVDVDIWGAETELVWVPNESWMLNASVSYLNTELGDLESFDPRDPAQGRQDVTTIKDLTNTAHCVLEHNGQGPVLQNAALLGAIGGAGVPYIPTGVDLGGGLTIPTTPGFAETALSVCSGLAAIAPAFGYVYSDGITVNLKGNELIQAPEWTVSLGAQYTHYFDNGWTLTGRADYYWQDDNYARTFNRPMDLIDSWDVVNVQAQLTGRDEAWFARVFVQNLLDDDNITGVYSTDPTSAFFTNAFLIEPRLVGLTVGMGL